MRGRGITWAALWVLAGCFGNETTEFPPGLEPLEESTAPAPEGTSSDPHPELLSLVSGTTDEHVWVHGRGYVHAPLATVWGALREPEVCVDRRAVDDYSIERDVDPAYEHSFRVHNTVNDIITVEFEITWRQGLVEGTASAPTLVAARYQKTWGTTFIEVLEGSVILRAVDDETTEVVLVEFLDAASGGIPAVRAYLEDLHSSLVAQSHGDPLPEY